MSKSSRSSTSRSVAGLVDFNGPIAGNYDLDRALSPEAVEGWRSAAICHAPRRVKTILDLGSGTGRFSTLLAEWFDASVIAAEPAAEMRAAALAHGADPRVRSVAARAEAIAVTYRSIDLVWLAFVIHHVADRRECVRELARVCRLTGTCLLLALSLAVSTASRCSSTSPKLA